MAADREWPELLGEVDQLRVRIDNSAEVAELNDDWSRCVEDSGYVAISSPPDAEEYIRSLATTAESIDDTGLVSVDDARVAEVRDLEIALSLADLDCQERVDYTARFDQIGAVYEKGFVEIHKAELEKWSLSGAG